MFGQIPDFTNGFEFLRKLWGAGAGLPSGLMPGLQAMTPPMDLDEIDKRIQDLKAVESWLQLNTNLLRTTIQGLEVQRATLVALQTFGNALSPEAMQSAMENVARAATTPSAAPPQRAPAEEAAPAERKAPAGDTTEASATQANASGDGSGAKAGKSQDSAPPNAALWWDMLQQQFNQIASSAAAASIAPFGMGSFGAGKPAAPAPAPSPAGSAGKSAAKPAPAKAGAKAPAARKKPAAKTAKTPPKPDNGEQGGEQNRKH